jgi:hypothetical protein
MGVEIRHQLVFEIGDQVVGTLRILAFGRSGDPPSQHVEEATAVELGERQADGIVPHDAGAPMRMASELRIRSSSGR